MKSRGTEAVISTKIAAPSAPTISLARARLQEIVDLATGKRLVVICAPAGYGKTTLMSQWAELVGDQGRRVAWLTLDEADNDPGRLYHYLDLVLRMADIKSVAGVRVDIDRIRGVAPAHATLLAALLERNNAPEVIFLDEFEAIDDPECQRLLEMLMNQLPAGVCLVVATRVRPSWKLAKLKVAGGLLEIDTDHLRLQASEVDAFHLLPPAKVVTDRVFDRIVSVMEGWVAGVQLALLAVQGHPKPEEFVELLLGRAEDVNDFLTQEVFNSLDRSMQEFLLLTSILDRFCAPLCQVLVASEGGSTQIRDLFQKGLFVQSLDNYGKWYRYHNIFRNFLLNRLEKRGKEAVKQLHARAAKWFTAHDLPEEGVPHALAAGDTGMAAEMLSRCIYPMVKRGQLETVEHYVSCIGPEKAKRFPEIVGGAAWAYTFLRRFNKLKEIIDQEACADHPDVRTLKPLLAIFQDELPEAHKLATANLDKIPEKLAFNRGVLLNIIAYCLVANSRFEEATATVAQAKAYHRKAGSVFGQTYSDVISALIDRARGNLAGALEKLENIENSNVAKSVSVGFHAELLYALGRIDEAARLLDRYFQLTVRNAPPDFVTLAYLIRARIAYAEGQLDRAYSIVEEGELVGASWPLPHMARIMRWERVRFALLRDKLDAARNFVLDTAPGAMPKLSDGDYLRLSDETTGEDIATLRLQVHTDPNPNLLSRIKKAMGAWKRHGRRWRVLKLQVLYAIARDKLGDEEGALRAMNDALVAGVGIGAVRTFVDEGVPAKVLMGKLADRLKAQDSCTLDQPQLAFLLRMLGSERGGIEARSKPIEIAPQLISVDLSMRERQILALLSRGLSNEDIGRQAFLSTNTVKWHLKRIYEKLGVKSRVEASIAARRFAVSSD